MNVRISEFIKKKETELKLEISLVQVEDAEFILNLRKDFKARYLNSSVDNLEQQVRWINEYKKREEDEIEFYFIFWSGKKRIGMIRFIKMENETFESGSWLFISGIPFDVAIRAELFCKDFAFELYDFQRCYFYFSKMNKQVIRYHSLFNPTKIKEDKTHVYYSLEKDTYYLHRDKVLSYCQR